jgi:hypothetical protein
MHHFNPELVARITKYFKQKYEVSITPSEAEEYLHSWAKLWVAVAVVGKAPQEPQTPPVIFIKLGT